MQNNVVYLYPNQNNTAMTQQFNKVKMNIERTSSYGHYKITAFYKGKHISTITTDSEAFDWFNDDSDKMKHREALRHCYCKISQFNN